jgi:hypothetical protein
MTFCTLTIMNFAGVLQVEEYTDILLNYDNSSDLIVKIYFLNS